MSEDASGRVTAVDDASGAAGKGDSVAEALADLATTLAGIEEDNHALTAALAAELVITDADPSPDATEFLDRARAVRARFDEEGVIEADVNEAIEWARSQ